MTRFSIAEILKLAGGHQLEHIVKDRLDFLQKVEKEENQGMALGN